MLRQRYRHLIQRLLSIRLRQYRGESGLTQEQMAELLCMAPRSYSDLEHGIYSCSGLTVILFLILLGDGAAIHLLHIARKLLKEAAHHDPAS